MNIQWHQHWHPRYTADFVVGTIVEMVAILAATVVEMVAIVERQGIS